MYIHAHIFIHPHISMHTYVSTHTYYVIVRTHFTVITCFNVARGRVNKGRVYIMHEPKASALCKRDLY